MSTDYRLGLTKVLAGCVLWGIGYPIWKILAEEIPPVSLVAFTFSLASVAVFLIYRLQVTVLARKFAANWRPLLLLGFFGGVLGTGLILFALSRIDTGIAAVLEKLQPVFVVVAARVFLHEIIPTSKIKWMLLAIACSYPIAIADLSKVDFSDNDALGLLAAAAASFFYGMNTIICKHLVTKDIAAQELIFFRMGIGCLVSYVVCLFLPSLEQNLRIPGIELVALMVLAVAISLVAAFMLFLSGLEHIPAATAAFLELLTPLVALGMSFVIFGDRLSLTQATAIPLFIFAVYQISRPCTKAE